MAKDELKKEEKKTETCKYGDLLKAAEMGTLMQECMAIAGKAIEAEFGDLAVVKDGSLGHFSYHLTCDLAVALFHRASAPDQSQIMLDGLEKGLEWYTAWQEKERCESKKRDEEFRASMSGSVPGFVLPRKTSPIERLLNSLMDVVSDFAREAFEKEEKIDPDDGEKANV